MSKFEGLAGPAERQRIEQRLGVNGFEITNLGSLGQASQIMTWRDLEDWEAGFELFEQYRALIGQGPKSITINGYPLAIDGYNVVVLDVRKLAHYPSDNIVGNKLESSPTAVLECMWTLMPKAI